jgi:hypothetical protein
MTTMITTPLLTTEELLALPPDGTERGDPRADDQLPGSRCPPDLGDRPVRAHGAALPAGDRAGTVQHLPGAVGRQEGGGGGRLPEAGGGGRLPEAGGFAGLSSDRDFCSSD